MKLISLTLFIIAIVALLVYTNPTMDEYTEFAGQQIVKRSDSKNEQNGVLSSMLSNVAGALAAGSTTRRNFVLFSIYRTTSGPKPQECIGILDNFFGCRILSSTASDSPQK